VHTPDPTPPGAKPGPTRPSRLWLIFVAAFAAQLVVWTAWIWFASRHPVAEVPLVTAPHR